MSYNLGSPNGLIEPVDLDDMRNWFSKELLQLPTASEREVLSKVVSSLGDFVKWPEQAVLLWDGCDRVAEEGRKQKYHRFPQPLKEEARKRQVYLDSRPNGPAIAAFQFAGGHRPPRFGSRNAWSVHHLYSGKFPYVGKRSTLHAAKSGRHFTQSAGLVAVHPIADALVDEIPFFAWFLRASAFHSFAYDPDGVFGQSVDDFGFHGRGRCVTLFT